MPLDFQTVDVQFTKGLDTDTNTKLVVPGKWTQLDNLTLTADGSLRRRDGYTALLPDENGHGLALHKDQLLTINGSVVNSVSTGGADQSVAVSGQLGNVMVGKKEIRRGAGVQDALDCAFGAGYTCYVWRDQDENGNVTGIRCSVVDETTGTMLLEGAAVVALNTLIGPRVVFAQQAFFIFYYDTTGVDTINCRVIQTSAPTVLGATVALVTSASLSARNFDACTYGSDSVLVAYAWNDGVTSMRALTVAHAAGVPSVSLGPLNLNYPVASLATANIAGIACTPYSATLWGIFVWGAGATALSGVSGVTVNDALAIVTGPTQLNATGPVAGAAFLSHITAVRLGTNFKVFTDNQASWNTNALVPLRMLTTSSVFGGTTSVTLVNSATFTAGATPSAQAPNGPFIYGKAFVSGSTLYLPACVLEGYDSTIAVSNTRNEQNSLLLLDATNATGAVTTALVAARALYGTFGTIATLGLRPEAFTPCSVFSPAAGVFGLACPEKTLLVFSNGVNISKTGIVSVSLTPNTTLAPSRAQLGESTYLAGGVLSTYDGSGVTEHGFPLFPEGITVVPAAGAGMTAGVHQVVAVYEWVDNSGQRHQSAPSLPSTATAAGGNLQLSVQVPTLLVSQKANVNIILYMTQAAGLTFNRVTSPNGVVSVVANDTTVAFVTIVISSSDAQIIGNELLYNQANQAGTTLPNLAPGPCNVLGVHQQRLFFDKADQPGQFGYSQLYVNNVGLQCNQALGGAVPATAGAIRGFASLDEKLIIFTARKPFVMSGSGPTAAGGFSSYSEPQEIPSDVGCSEPSSILAMPQGLIFKSTKGWYLLGRDLTVRYIGAGVAAYDANSVSAAVLLEDRQECRFTSLAGRQLIYSYNVRDADGVGQWSTQIAHPNAGTYAVADALWWPALSYFVHITPTTGLNRDTPGVFVDQPGNLGARGIVTTGRTAFLRVGVLNGFQRVRWLYLTMTALTRPDSTLRIDVLFDDDYLGNFSGYNFSTVLSTIGFTNGDVPYDLRHKLRHQKCKSVAFIFTETPALSTDVVLRGMQALALEVGLKKGVNRLQAAQGVG